MPELLLALLVLAMGSNPIPCDVATVTDSQGANASGNARRPNLLRRIDFLKVEAGREGVFLELFECFSCLRAQFRGELLERITE